MRMLDIKKMQTIASAAMLVFVMVLALCPVLALATTPDTSIYGVDVVGSETGLTGGGASTDFRKVLGQIIKTVLGFLGVVAVVVILIGGFKYMTAGGSDDKVKKARDYILYGIIGLAIILSAYALTSYVFTALLAATQAGAQ